MSIQHKRLGRTDLTLSTFGFGSTALGNIYAPTTEQESIATLDAAHAAGIRYFDTAPLYGHGLAELRVGAGLRSFADPEVVISTKVGWRLRAARGSDTKALPFQNITAFSRYNDYSYDGAMRSFEESLQRLGTDRIDVLLIHDVDRRNQGERYAEALRSAMSGAYRALLALREQGAVKAIGAGLNEWEACRDFAEAGDFDCFLLAGRYTLLEQNSLASFLPLCEQRGIGIILGGPYNSGILASGAVPGAYYDYAPASQAVLERVAAIERVCGHHHVALKAAALQFPLHHPCVASVIPGTRTPAEVAENLAMFKSPIPTALWQELKAARLMDEAAPTP
jgi:D-threo-aldose 1-dehydrogenase